MEIIFAIILIGLAFYMLAIVSEEFFVPAIDILSDRLKLSQDAAGATLLAAGSSAPEFFTSLIAILGTAQSGHSDIGAGTIVGSAIFNVLVIVGISAMFKSVSLNWKPVIRDQLFYILTILLLLWSFTDGAITLVESSVFLGVYGLYVYAVINWRRWFHYTDNGADITVSPESSKAKNRLHRSIRLAIAKVIPDPDQRPRLSSLTFVLAIVSIAALSWLLVQQVVVIAVTLRINPTFLALTVLAVGTSLPDLIGSIVVAKQGRGDMAVSNAIGSNIFDVLFGLGLPWTLYILINGQSASVGKENLIASILLLFATVISILFLLIARNWRLGRRSGAVLVGLYAAYIVYTVSGVVRIAAL